MPPTTYDDFRRKGAIGIPLENKTTTEGYRFYKKVYERFLECKIKLNTEDRSVVSISHPQDPSSEYLYRALASNSSEFRFSANFKVFQGTKRGGVGLPAYDFFAIHPIQYKRNYVDNVAKVFHYVEIHTARYIEVFLYNSEQFKSTSRGNYFNTQYSVSNVTECLRLIRLTLALEPEQVEETWGRSLLDQMQENLVGNSIPLGDFHLIDLNPNNMFLSTILAYGILAYSMERFERFRSDTSVPFLLVIDCSSIKRNKNYSDIRTYIKRIHAACYMPDGSYGADFPPKSAKDYEEYLNRPHLARRVPLIEATDKFKVEEAFSAFYDSINKSTFVRQKCPYGSLPLIITEKGDDYPEKFFSNSTRKILNGMMRLFKKACHSF